MIPIISLIIITLISLMIVKIGATALAMTGLSKDIASFQAHSAFSGVGFTTSEAEYVVNHPLRRRIIRILILLGNIGITSAIASLVFSFSNLKDSQEGIQRILVIFAFTLIVYLSSKINLIDIMVEKVIKWILSRWTDLTIIDYDKLLAIDRGYSIANITVQEGEWLADKTLTELRLNREGILVLGIRRKNKYFGAPPPDSKVLPDDVITCYGNDRTLRKLRKRKRGVEGDREHQDSIDDFNERQETPNPKGPDTPTPDK